MDAENQHAAVKSSSHSSSSSLQITSQDANSVTYPLIFPPLIFLPLSFLFFDPVSYLVHGSTQFTVNRRYTLLKSIGHGAYGVVWYAISLYLSLLSFDPAFIHLKASHLLLPFSSFVA
jgi:hypothetical protein